MGRGFITGIFFTGKNRRDCRHCTFTFNELERGEKRYNKHVEEVRKEDIKKKRAMTIDNARSFA